MSHTFQRLANTIVGSVGRVRAAAVDCELAPRWLGYPTQAPWKRESDVRMEERRQERTRIARELHDTLFQGFLGAP
jgi:signal transduction histidine kinase